MCNFSGGVKFSNLSETQADKFQENVLLTILQLEKTYFDMAAEDHGNCLVVCDRGAMDASACELLHILFLVIIANFSLY